MTSYRADSVAVMSELNSLWACRIRSHRLDVAAHAFLLDVHRPITGGFDVRRVAMRGIARFSLDAGNLGRPESHLDPWENLELSTIEIEDQVLEDVPYLKVLIEIWTIRLEITCVDVEVQSVTVA